LNGTELVLTTSNQPLQLATQHLVVTYRSGRETLYVNGTEHTTVHPDTLVDLLVGGLGQEFKLIVYSIIMFPLGILSYAFCARKATLRAKGVVSFGIALAGVALIGGFCLSITKVELEPSFFVVAAATLSISLFTAPQLLTKT